MEHKHELIPPGPTRRLAAFIAETGYEHLDTETVEMAKNCLIDFIGVAVAGARLPSARILSRYFTGEGKAGSSCLLDGSGRTFDPMTAAAVNAAYGHADDMDDVQNESIMHLGAVTIPSALALGMAEKISGKELILALVLGYDVGARAGRAILPESYDVWHTTAVAGPLAAAAVSASILKLDADRTAHALGSAGTQAGGLWAFLKTGAMSKLLHVANANLCGIRAARLATMGFTGAVDILESPKGFVAGMAGAGHLTGLDADLAQPFLIRRNSFKPYACCRHTHSAVYGVLCMKEEYGLRPEDIRQITDYTYSIACRLTDNPRPDNVYAAKFSLQYCIAAALTRPAFAPEVFSPQVFGDPALRDMMGRIHVVQDEAVEAAYQADSTKWGHRLRVEMKDGAVYERLFSYPLGDYNNPMDRAALEEKFLSLTKDLLPPEKGEAILRRIEGLEELEDINELFQ